MKENNYTFEDLAAILPDGWRAKAKELGALQRSREIKTPEDLLKLIFLYLTEGKSFGNTSALLNTREGRHMTKKAIYTRLCNSGKWLRWLCENLCRETRLLAEKPAWLENRTVYMVDTGNEPVYSSSKTGCRLHYCIGLFDLGIREIRLTGTKTGEKPSDFQGFGKDDLIIAGGAYGTIAGIEYLSGCGGDYLLEYQTGAFSLYTREQERAETTDYFQSLKAGECGEVTLYYKLKEEYKPVRLCAIRKTEEVEGEGVEQQKVMKGKNPGKPSGRGGAQSADNRYIMVITSLSETDAASILELYHFQQQIEPVFKRLKSLLGYDQIPPKVDASAKARVYGKLLLAAFYESRANKAGFSPAAVTSARYQGEA